MKDRDAVTALLKDCPGGLSTSAVADEMGWSPGRTGAWLGFLRRRGEIERIKPPSGVAMNGQEGYWRHTTHLLDSDVAAAPTKRRNRESASANPEVEERAFRLAMAAATKVTGIAEATILLKVRAYPLVRARMIVALLMLEQGASKSDVGRKLDMDSSSVWHLVQRSQSLIPRNHEGFRDQLESAREIIREKFGVREQS